MNDIFMPIIGIFIFSFAIWLLITQEPRAVKKIKKDALKKGVKIKEIREPNINDDKNPFSKFIINPGGISNIFGFSGEKIYFKIVETKESKYWVRVETIFFIPSKIEWSKE